MATPLAGARFSVYRAADFSLIGEMTTDTEGNAEEKPKPEPETGVAEICKVDADNPGHGLKGAIFGVYLADGDAMVEKIATDGSGVAASKPLPLGKYYVREITAPAGYELSDEKHAFELTEKGQTVRLTVSNNAMEPATGRMRLVKTDEQGNPLPGAVFGIYKADGNAEPAGGTTPDGVQPMGLMVSGPDGTAVSGDLPMGRYYLLEKTAPQGYRLSTEKHHFTLTEGALLNRNAPSSSPSASSSPIHTGSSI